MHHTPMTPSFLQGTESLITLYLVHRPCSLIFPGLSFDIGWSATNGQYAIDYQRQYTYLPTPVSQPNNTSGSEGLQPQQITPTLLTYASLSNRPRSQFIHETTSKDPIAKTCSRTKATCQDPDNDIRTLMIKICNGAIMPKIENSGSSKGFRSDMSED